MSPMPAPTSPFAHLVENVKYCLRTGDSVTVQFDFTVENETFKTTVKIERSREYGGSVAELHAILESTGDTSEQTLPANDFGDLVADGLTTETGLDFNGYHLSEQPTEVKLFLANTQ